MSPGFGISSTTPIGKQLADECHAMARFALSTGRSVPVRVVQVMNEYPLEASDALDAASIRALSRAHERLTQVVAPATPRTIMLMEAEPSTFLEFMGPVRLARSLSLLAVGLVVAFIALALSPDVNRTARGILDTSGLPLLLNLLFLLSAAGLGATFAALFRISPYIAAGTYDPRYESTYWIRIILGLIAGLLLAELLPEVMGLEDGANAAGFNLGRPLLALVGGFSAAVVFRILNRVVEAVESLVRGDTRQMVQSQIARAHADVSHQLRQERTRIAVLLLHLQQRLERGEDPAAIGQALRGAVEDLIPHAMEDRLEGEGASAPGRGATAESAQAAG